ncbi:MAG: MBL fold metallo-hydrolase [Thermoanaerobaculia bacterium]
MTLSRRQFVFQAPLAVIVARSMFAQTPAATVQIERLSWAGIRLEFGETTVFIDALGAPAGAWKGPIVPLAGRTPRVGAAITHMHNDQFDQPSLHTLLGDNGQVICSSKVAATVASRGFKLRSVEMYEPLAFGDVTLTAVPASDGLGEPQVSWIVMCGERRIIHGGDTLWHGSFRQIGTQFGPFDAAFLPINGFQLLDAKPPSGQPSSLTPEQAVSAAVLLRAKSLVPIHYGASDADYAETPDAESRLRAAASQRNVPLRILKPGEIMTLSA